MSDSGIQVSKDLLFNKSQVYNSVNYAFYLKKNILKNQTRKSKCYTLCAI